MASPSARPKSAGTSSAPAQPSKQQPPAQAQFRALGLRLGLPLLGGWVIALLARHWIAYAIMGVLTALGLGLVAFIWSFTRKSQRVQSIVGGASTPEERKDALERIDREFKKDDTAAIFAKAQLQMHEDPRAALTTLETIQLDKVLPNIADEARAQRAMLHLLLNEPKDARPLADAIDLSRHADGKARATVGAVICEAWARTGQSKRAVEILALFDTNDEALAEAKPGLLRAQVYAFAAVDDLKKARSSMHQLAKFDPRAVAAFAQRGMHPLLVQEAKKILEKSGAMPRIQVRSPSR